ncbi:MAG: hypothetical protein ACOZQL_07950 [Myxococcota bacterium]
MNRWARVVTLALFGCECGTSTTSPDAAGPEDASTELPDVRDASVGTLRFHLERDFGPVVRGQSKTLVATFVNESAASARISALSTTQPAFHLDDATPFDVAAGASVERSVVFTPDGLGPRAARLQFAVDGAATAIDLSGLGVGPSLDLAPTTLELGVLRFYDGEPAIADAGLRLENVGLAAPGLDTDLLATFEVIALDGTADELCLGDCSGDTVPIPVGGVREVPVALTASTPGPRRYDVRVFSNDPAQPLREVRVTAQIERRPTCLFALPPRLSFGVLSAAEQRQRELFFENTGTEPCEVASIALVDEQPAGQPPLFSLVSPPTTPTTLQPGEVLRVRVRASARSAPPTSPTAVTAHLELDVNSPAGPARAELDATLEQSCLTLVPGPLDFGAVRTGCRSPARTVYVVSSCLSPITVQSVTSSSPLFTVSTAALPATPLWDFTVQYAPGAVGEDLGAVEVTWSQQGGALKRTVLEVRGRANLSGQQVDHFPPLPLQHDVLLIIDDSASMSVAQSRLATLLPPLLQELQTQQVDFHLAVLDGDTVGPEVFRATSTGLKVLTPQTATPARFAELLHFTGARDWESCAAPVLRALTPPKVGDPSANAGFLRPGVPLSVVCITDQPESNPLLEPAVLAALPRDVVWNAIVPLGNVDPLCSPQGAPSWFDAQRTLTEATGGLRHELCSMDWRPLLDLVAQRTSSGPRARFVLSGHPDPTGQPPLAVTVNGVGVPPSLPAGSTVWEWMTQPRDAVVFGAAFAPRPRDAVDVSWPTACSP